MHNLTSRPLVHHARPSTSASSPVHRPPP